MTVVKAKIIRPNYVHESKVLPGNASQVLENGKYELSFLGFSSPDLYFTLNLITHHL